MIIITALLLFYTVNNLIWYRLSTAIPININEALRLQIINNTYARKDITTTEFNHTFRHGQFSPFYHMAAAIPGFFGASTLNSMRMVNMMWFLIILVSVYYFSRTFLNREAALYSMVILSFYPAIYGFSRMFRESFGLIGPVVLCFLFLLKSKNFSSTRNTVFFAVFAGISVMIRKTAVIFITVPAFYLFIESFFSTKINRRFFLNIFYALLIIAAISGYRFINPDLLKTIVIIPYEEPKGYWLEYWNIRIYTVGLMNYLMSMPFLVLFIFGLIRFIRTKLYRNMKIMLLLWVLVPFLFFNIIPHINKIRNVLPYMPVFALISGYGLSNIRKRSLKMVAVSLFLVIGLIQYYEFSFGMGMELGQLKVKIGNIPVYYFHSDKHTDHNCSIFKPIRNKIYDDVVSYISGRSGQLLAIPPFVPASHIINNLYWDIYAKFGSPPFEVKVWTPDIQFFPEFRYKINKADYILLPAAEMEEGLSGYLDIIIQDASLNYNLHMPASKNKLKELYRYLDKGYSTDKDEIIKKFAAFKKVDTFRDVHGIGYVLYEREK